MGIQDFMEAFNRLDPAQTGFVTLDQIYCLQNTIHVNHVAWDHIEAAVWHVCGSKNSVLVGRESFIAVLEEVERRRCIEEQAYWDFQALDCNGSHRICLQDAMTLFQEYHGDGFSLHTWHKFLHSRLDPDADVSFDEIRGWLCDAPSGEPSKKKELKEEALVLKQAQWKHSCQDYEAFKELQKDEGNDQEEDDEYKESLQKHAKRKLDRWQHQGLKAMLLDDELEDTENFSLVVSCHHMVNLSDVLAALNLKYSLLIDALVLHMAAYAANIDSEEAELFRQIKRGVTKVMKYRRMKDIDSLPGASAQLPMTLLGLMGDLKPDHQQRLEEFEILRQRLTLEGKSARDIDKQLQIEHEKNITGPLNCGHALLSLIERKMKETELLRSIARGSADPTLLKMSLLSEFCRLHRQHIIISELHNFIPVALAVGLAERPQIYKPVVYNSDRMRSEYLAAERLASRRGHAALRTTSQTPDLVTLQDSGIISIHRAIIAELELCHHLEREAAISMLQGPEAAESRSVAERLKADERHLRLTTLRSHYLNWKANNSGNSALNYKILREALGLYWFECQCVLEKQWHNIAETTINAAILADLQQKQELDFAQCLLDIHGKNAEGLILLLKQLCRKRLEEHFENFASLVLGVVQMAEEEQECINALKEKYRAIRDQVFVTALREKHGLRAWNSLGREGRQKEIQKMRKEEKKLRGEGRLSEMATMFHPKSLVIPTLESLLGENKIYGKAPVPDMVFKSQNLLADLVSRFNQEHNVFLAWLQGEEVKEGKGQNKKQHQLICLELERFVVGVDGDYESGLLAMGLLERIAAVISGRSVGDKERQQRLAAKRVALHKWRTLNGEMYKIPAEDKNKPGNGDVLGWQKALLRSIIRRQAAERELMLQVVLDAGFTELVEAAGMIAAEERWQRQAELKHKHQALDLSTADGQEEHLSILEEVAALRVVGVRSLARQQLGKEMPYDGVVTALMTELQDLHDIELAKILQSIGDIDESLLKQKVDDEKRSRTEEHAGAVLTVLTSVDEDSQITDAFVKLLKEKYTALCESLILAAVEHKGGAQLSQKQKLKQISALRKEVIPLWDAGDAESVTRVLGVEFSFERPLGWLLGMDRGRFAMAKTEGKGLTTHAIKESDIPETGSMLASVKCLIHRFQEESKFIHNCLAGVNGQFLSDKMKLALKSRLRREIFLISEEDGIKMSAIVCGLAERQPNQMNGFCLEKDCERYRLVATHECEKRQHDKDIDQEKGKRVAVHSQDQENLQDAVLRQLHMKHIQERQLLIKMLNSQNLELARQTASLQSSQQRADKLAALRSKRQSSSLDSSPDNLFLLQEALIVLREVRRDQERRGITETDDLHLHHGMMADLLLLQNIESEQYLEDFSSEDSPDMTKLQEQIVKDISNSHCRNIALMLFSNDFVSKTEEKEEAVIDALRGKYDALRDKLFIEALIKEMGENDWHILTEKEQMKKLMEMKLKERKLRHEKKYDELAALLGDALNNEATLKRMIGNNKAEAEQKLREQLTKRKQRLADGLNKEECDRLEKEEEAIEEEESKHRVCNVLLNLEHNFKKEQDDLMQQLADYGNDEEKEKERQHFLLQLKLQQRRLRQEDDIHSCALLLNQNSLANKHLDSERQRQEQLAQERLHAAQYHQLTWQDSKSENQLSIFLETVDAENDCTHLQEMALTSLDLRHQAERIKLIKILKDRPLKNVPEPTADNIKKHLEDILEIYQVWRTNPSVRYDDDTGLQILQEASFFTCALKQQQLALEKKPISESALQTALLADLQEVQEKEAKGTLLAVSSMDVERLRLLVSSIIKDKEKGCHDNLAKVLLKPCPLLDVEHVQEEGISEEQRLERKIVKALEMKYDALRDKILIEALISQHGEAEWRRMSELKRQYHIVELRRQERKLRHEGKMSELGSLLGEHLRHKQELNTLLGESQKNQKLRLQQRLALRQKLKSERDSTILPEEETAFVAVEEEEEEEKRNVFENLQMHFENEKAALLAKFQQDANISEREKHCQNALVKLHHEKHRLLAEERLDSAVLLFTLNQQHGDKSLLTEHKQHQLLAKERLTKWQQQVVKGHNITRDTEFSSATGATVTPPCLLSEGLSQLQKDLLAALDKHHEAERDLFLLLLAKIRSEKDVAENIHSASDEELKIKLNKIQEEYTTWLKESIKMAVVRSNPHLLKRGKSNLIHGAGQHEQVQQNLLAKALIIKLELENRHFTKLLPSAKDEEIWEEIYVHNIADLQEQQMVHFNSVQESIFSKTELELMELYKLQHQASQNKWFESLMSVVFSVNNMDGKILSMSMHKDTETESLEEFLQQKQAVVEKAKQERLGVFDMLQELELQNKTDRQMLKNAESSTVQKRAVSQRSQTHSLLEERLKQHSEARKKTMKQKQEELNAFDDRDSLHPTQYTTHLGSRKAESPMGGLQRERTPLEIIVSEDQKQAIYDKLVQEQLKEQSTKTAELQRQKEELERRLKAKKGKREDEVAALFQLGERQKASLENALKGERERQIAQLKDHVSRMRYERTLTQRASTLESDKAHFRDIQEKGDDHTQEEARKLDEKFRKHAAQAMFEADNKVTSGEAVSLSENNAMDILKEHHKQKKQQQQEKF